LNGSGGSGLGVDIALANHPEGGLVATLVVPRPQDVSPL